MDSDGRPECKEIAVIARRLLAGGKDRSALAPVNGIHVSEQLQACTNATKTSRLLPVKPPERSGEIRGGELARELRRAVARSELTRHHIATHTGLSYAVVHGFMSGGDIQLSTASKIASLVGIKFT